MKLQVVRYGLAILAVSAMAQANVQVAVKGASTAVQAAKILLQNPTASRSPNLLLQQHGAALGISSQAEAQMLFGMAMPVVRANAKYFEKTGKNLSDADFYRLAEAAESTSLLPTVAVEAIASALNNGDINPTALTDQFGLLQSSVTNLSKQELARMGSAEVLAAYFPQTEIGQQLMVGVHDVDTSAKLADTLYAALQAGGDDAARRELNTKYWETSLALGYLHGNAALGYVDGNPSFFTQVVNGDFGVETDPTVPADAYARGGLFANEKLINAILQNGGSVDASTLDANAQAVHMCQITGQPGSAAGQQVSLAVAP